LKWLAGSLAEDLTGGGLAFGPKEELQKPFHHFGEHDLMSLAPANGLPPKSANAFCGLKSLSHLPKIFFVTSLS